VQAPDAWQSPLQPASTVPPLPWASRGTRLPWSNRCVHWPGQSSPSGSERTRPSPSTASTSSCPGGGRGAKCAITERAAVIDRVHCGALPRHEPSQPANFEPESGNASSVTLVPDAYQPVQSGSQSIPADGAATRPPPSTATSSGHCCRKTAITVAGASSVTTQFGPECVVELRDGLPHAWVLDFGLARELGDPSLTRSGGVFGTPAFMSPEQARGTTTLDRRSDVFALGATLHFALTGESPFAA